MRVCGRFLYTNLEIVISDIEKMIIITIYDIEINILIHIFNVEIIIIFR